MSWIRLLAGALLRLTIGIVVGIGVATAIWAARMWRVPDILPVDSDYPERIPVLFDMIHLGWMIGGTIGLVWGIGSLLRSKPR
jgi:hypothetical protein